MKQEYVKAFLNILLTFILFILFITIVPRIWIYFLPFIIAWIIAACASPIVQFLEKKIKIKRKMGSALVIILVIALIALLFYGLLILLINQITGLVNSLPDLTNSLIKLFDQLQLQLVNHGIMTSDKINSFITQGYDEVTTALTNFANGNSKVVISFVGEFTKRIPLVLIGIIVTLLSSYFFVSEKKEHEAYFKRKIPKSIMDKINLFKKSIQEAIGGYLKAQFKIILWVFLILLIGLFILRVNYAIVIAFLIACLDFLPILGAGMIMVPWALISFAYHDIRLAIGLLIVWALTQTFRQLIQPKYMGESIGLKPLPTLALLYFGYCIAGMAGLILSVPVGYVVISMVNAGAFKTTYESIKILVTGFNEFRKLKSVDEETSNQDQTNLQNKDYS